MQWVDVERNISLEGWELVGSDHALQAKDDVLGRDRNAVGPGGVWVDVEGVCNTVFGQLPAFAHVPPEVALVLGFGVVLVQVVEQWGHVNVEHGGLVDEPLPNISVLGHVNEPAALGFSNEVK